MAADVEDGRYCGHCGADQRGGRIPPTQALPLDEWKVWKETGRLPDDFEERLPRYYSHTMAVEVLGAGYDGVLFYKCPFCGYAWHRWRDRHMRAKAQPYIDCCNLDIGVK